MTNRAFRACRGCVHAADSTGSVGGIECRRNAPQPSGSATPAYTRPYWPIVNGDDWCGEWKSRQG